jgi:Tfp pilus assembly protein PilO
LQRTLRQTVTRALEIAGASLILLDVLLYFAMFRPVHAKVSLEQQRFATLRRSIFDGEIRIEQLKEFLAELPGAGERLSSFEQDHVPPRRQGFSEAAKLLRNATGQSATQLTYVGYKLDNAASGPLQRLGLVVNVAGAFPALLKFSHALETANVFVVLRSFTIAPGERGAMAMRVTADLYLKP